MSHEQDLKFIETLPRGDVRRVVQEEFKFEAILPTLTISLKGIYKISPYLEIKEKEHLEDIRTGNAEFRSVIPFLSFTSSFCKQKREEIGSCPFL